MKIKPRRHYTCKVGDKYVISFVKQKRGYDKGKILSVELSDKAMMIDSVNIAALKEYYNNNCECRHIIDMVEDNDIKFVWDYERCYLDEFIDKFCEVERARNGSIRMIDLRKKYFEWLHDKGIYEDFPQESMEWYLRSRFACNVESPSHTHYKVCNGIHWKKRGEQYER